MLKQILSLLVCAPLLLGGCGDSQDEASGTRTLTLVTSADFPPFEYFSTGNGDTKIVGFDIEVAQRIGTYLGYEIEVRDVDFASIIPTLQSSRADFAMAGITPTEERAKNIDFSQPYYFMNNVMLYRKNNNFMGRKDYEDMKVTVLLGSTQEQFARTWAESHKGVTIVPMNRVGDAVQEVLAGRADGAILDATPAQAYLDKYSDTLTQNNLEGDRFGAAIAFPKGSKLVDDFNRALTHLRDTGALDEIVHRWLVS